MNMVPSQIIGPGSERKKITIFGSVAEYLDSDMAKEDQRIAQEKKENASKLSEKIMQGDFLLTFDQLKFQYERLQESDLFIPNLKIWKKEKSPSSSISSQDETITQFLNVELLKVLKGEDEANALLKVLIAPYSLYNEAGFWKSRIINHNTYDLEDTATQLMFIIAAQDIKEHKGFGNPYRHLKKSELYDNTSGLWYEGIDHSVPKIYYYSKSALTNLIGVIAAKTDIGQETMRAITKLKFSPLYDDSTNRYRLKIDHEDNFKEDPNIYTSIELADVIVKTLTCDTKEARNMYKFLLLSPLHNLETGEWYNSFNPNSDFVDKTVLSFNQLMGLYAMYNLIKK